MALTVRWYNGAPYLTEDTSKTTDPVWYNAAPNVEYYEYVGLTEGDSICWGRKTLVAQTLIRQITGNWTGTGSIEGTAGEDNEKIALNAGENMVSEVCQTGSGSVTLAINTYNTGDNCAIYWRTGATQVACEAASWTLYSTQFDSTGYVQIKVEPPI